MATVQTRLTLGDCARRAYSRAVRETDEGSGDLTRVELIASLDDHGGPGVLELAEYAQGDLALYLASKDDPSSDQWIVVTKLQCAALSDAATRCK